MTAVPQHMQSLERATEIRNARGILKRRVANGELTVVDVLKDTPRCAATMTLYDLLRAQRQWGPYRAAMFLEDADLREDKKVGELTQRQCNVVTALLTGFGA